MGNEQTGIVRILVKLKPGAKKNSIETIGNNTIAVSVTSRPVNGKANQHLAKILAKALHIPKSAIEIIHGLKSRDKVLNIYSLNKGDIFKKLEKVDIH